MECAGFGSGADDGFDFGDSEMLSCENGVRVRVWHYGAHFPLLLLQALEDGGLDNELLRNLTIRHLVGG